MKQPCLTGIYSNIKYMLLYTFVYLYSNLSITIYLYYIYVLSMWLTHLISIFKILDMLTSSIFNVL